MHASYSITKSRAVQKLSLQLVILAAAAAGGGFALSGVWRYWLLLVICVGLAGLAVRNIRCWVRVFLSNVGAEALQVRHE